jgi:hypothetical protein
LKLIGWLLFVLVQIIALSMQSTGSPLLIKIIGMVLLLPSSGFVYLFGGERLSAPVMRNTSFEIAASVIFFAVNALCWLMVAQLLRHYRTSKQLN